MSYRDGLIATGQVLIAVAFGYAGVAAATYLASTLLKFDLTFDGREAAFFLSTGVATVLVAAGTAASLRSALALAWPAEGKIALKFAVALVGVFVVEAAVLFSGVLGSLGDLKAMSDSERSLLGFANAVILAPLVEEALFRGLLFTRLRGRLAAFPTIAIVTLAFGLLHAENGLAHVLSVLPAGAFLGLARETSGGIGLPILLHGTMNLAVVIAGIAA